MRFKGTTESQAIIGAVTIVSFYLTMSWVVANDYQTYLMVIREGGPFETVGAISSLLAATFFFIAYIRYPEESPFFSRMTKRSPFVLALGLASLFLFLEEISWGQRILDLETPGWLAEINQQGEINLHNIAGIHKDANRYGKGLLEIYFVILPVLAFLSPLIRRLFTHLGLPIPDMQFALFFLLSGIAYRNFYWRAVLSVGAEQNTNFGEVLEVVIEVVLLFFAYKYFSRVRFEYVTTADPGRIR